jgi:hypothetical protein
MRIFISHGLDKAVAADMRFLDALEAALQAAGQQVLLDRSQLDLGDAWQHVLHELLAECDAAVLLLSPRALTRPWVLKEATILAYRKALQADFPLYPVLLGGVQPQALERADFSPLCLLDLQAHQQPVVDEPGARALAAQLHQRMAGWLAQQRGGVPDTPLELLQQELQDLFRQAASPPALQQLCESLTGRPLQWRPGGATGADAARLIAATLMNGLDGGTGMAGAAGAGGQRPLATLIRQLDRSFGLGSERATRVLKLLAPLWTRPADAALLADAAGRNRLPAGPAQPGHAVALQCELGDFCAEQHVRRALMPTQRGQVVCTLAGGHSDNRLDELKAAIRQEYRRRNRVPASTPDNRVDERLAQTGTTLEQCSTAFFLIPDPPPDADLLAELRRCFPRLTFILHSTGPLPEPLPPGVLALPAIDIDLEYRMNEDLTAAYDQIGA